MIVGYSRGCARCGNSVALQLVGRSAIGADVDWIGIAHREGPPADNRRGVPRRALRVVQGAWRRSCQSSFHRHGAGGDERRVAWRRSCQSSFHRHGAGGDERRVAWRRSCQSSFHRHGAGGDERRVASRRSCQSSFHRHGAGGDERRVAWRRSCQSSFHRHGAGGDGRRQRRLPRFGRTMPKIPTQCKRSIISKLELDGTLVVVLLRPPDPWPLTPDPWRSTSSSSFAQHNAGRTSSGGSFASAPDPCQKNPSRSQELHRRPATVGPVPNVNRTRRVRKFAPPDATSQTRPASALSVPVTPRPPPSDFAAWAFDAPAAMARVKVV